MLSIAMATYNGEKYLREQIDSILKQTIQDFELIACDDCSTDTTWDILQEYQLQDKRIKCYRNDENLGFKKNFEKAIRLCVGEYIALSDQDDIWTEDHLQILFENIDKNDLCAGNALFVDEKMNALNFDMLKVLGIDFIPKTNLDWLQFLVHKNVFQGAAILFRKELARNCLPSSDDCMFHDYWLALNAVLNDGVQYVNVPILYYRQHDTNVTGFSKSNMQNRIKSIYKEKKFKYSASRQLNLLSNFIDYNYCKEYSKIIRDAFSYYQNDVFRKKKISKIIYFIKNYVYMNLSKNKKLFLLRLIKEIFLK